MKKKTIIILAILIFNPITGLIIWYLDGYGIFVFWKSLGSPPEKPVEILGSDVRNTGVSVLSGSGKIYEYHEYWNYWTEISKDKVIDYSFPECLTGKSDRVKHLSREIDNHAVHWCGEMDWGRAYYSILEDGSVWVWKHSSTIVNSILKMLISLCSGTTISLILLILLLKMKKQENSIMI